mgnify:CR=1 FL=1
MDKQYYKCEQEKTKEFEQLLRNRNTDLNSFIELYNKWSQMTPQERGECIDKLVW